MKNIVTVNRAAAILGVSRQRVHQLLVTGRLKGRKLHPKAWLVYSDSVNLRRLGKPQ